MNNPSFLTESFGRKSLLCVVVSIFTLVALITGAAVSQERKSTDKQEAFRRIVRNYVQAGQEEYQRGFYEEAVKTFLMAQEYQKYLPAEEQQQLSIDIKKAQSADTQRKQALKIVQTANLLIKQKQLNQAKADLESVEQSAYLTKDEKQQINTQLNQINAQLREKENRSNIHATAQIKSAEKLHKIANRQKAVKEETSEQQSIATVFYHSVAYYRSGQLEKARQGFARVLEDESVPEPMRESVRNYLTRIDETLRERNTNLIASGTQRFGTMSEMEEPNSTQDQVLQEPAPEPNQPVRTVPEYPETIPQPTTPRTRPNAQIITSPVTGEGSYMDQVNRTRNIIRDYTQTVVSDAIDKALRLAQQGQFDRARNELSSADMVVEQNRIQLGEELYNQHKNALKAASDEITVQERVRMRQEEQQKRQEAATAQQQLREQMEAERQKRIAELMENALTYQKQQHYEAALGQLESLLVLDPQNNQALILKQTIEDTLFFKRQLEIKREGDQQRADILLKTDESTIPYAEELTYPKNWREIESKRKPEEPIGLDVIDANVYERLDQYVDLSDITESTSFYQVLDILSNATTPPLQIQPNWRDLMDNANIDRTTPAEMEPLTGIKIRKALDLLLAGLSTIDYEIGYVVDEGVIYIATTESLPSKMVSRVYDISDLVGTPSTGQSMMGGMGGMMGGMGGMMGGMGGMGGMMGGMGGYGGGMMGGMGGGMMGGMGGYGGGMMGGMGGGYGGMSGGYGGMGGGGYGGMGGGGYGGMGGGGYGGMGGGYGGMGGGGYGGMGGGYGGGMMGGMGGYGMGNQMGGIIAQDLINLIEETIEPDTWFDLSDTGEGTIMPYPQQQPKKLAVMQTHEVHEEIQKLLTAMRRALGNQISIEARYLVVTENFLEEIGLDVDFSYNFGGKWGIVTFNQDSAVAAQAEPTQVPLSLGGIGAAGTITGGYGSILDDLQVSFLLKATQAHRDARALTAPIVTVLSGESASFSINRAIPIALPPIQQPGVTSVGTGAAGGTVTGTGGGIQPQYTQVPQGSQLFITPVITHDKKYVLLNIQTIQNEFLGIRTTVVETPIVGGVTGTEVEQYTVQLPETQTSQVATRVGVPDGGTLLLGGQKISVELDTEAGVPILSKIPILGRLFSNRSTVRDQQILLILVKPSIILQEEREAEALAALESGM